MYVEVKYRQLVHAFVSGSFLSSNVMERQLEGTGVKKQG